MADQHRRRIVVGVFPDRGVYRLDWVGPMQRLERGSRIPVQFSKLASEHRKIVDDESIFESRKIVVPVGFGYVPILQPGTIWHNRVFSSRWRFNRITAHAEVGSHVPIVAAWDRASIDGVDRYVVPPSAFKIDSRVSASRMALFDATADGRRIMLIVPCMEIFRFYYGHSTRLAYRILRGDVLTAPHWLYESDGTHVDADGRARLDLAASMDAADGYTVARFALDSAGLARARAIVTRTMLDEGGTSAIDVLPPFNGPWRVRVTGKWLHYGGTAGFLVLAILNCDGPVPFRHLSVYGGFTREQYDPAATKSVTQDSPTIERRRAVAPDSDVFVDVGDPGFNEFPQRLPPLDGDDRYPDIPIVHITRRRRRLVSVAASRGGRAIKTIHSSGPRSTAISDTPVDEGPRPGFISARSEEERDQRVGRDLLELCRRAVYVLRDTARAGGYDCFVQPRIVDVREVFAFQPPPEAYLDRKADKTRLALIADINLNASRVLVLEIQRRPGAREQCRTLIAADTSLQLIDDARLMKILARWILREGHLRDLDGVPTLRDIRLSGANHLDRDTEETYAARLLAKMVALIEEIDAGALN